MIISLFHAWERRHASVSKDRRVRPFKWGLEWIKDNEQHVLGPEERLRAWVTGQMSDTTAFLDAPITREYQFEHAPPDERRQGEAGTLRSPSAFVTPHV